MAQQVTRRNLDGFAETLNRYELPGHDLYVEHTASGYTLYGNKGRTEMLFGRTKAELFDLMHAFAFGLRVGRGDDVRFNEHCKLCGAPKYGLLPIHHHNDPETGEVGAARIETVAVLFLLSGLAYLAGHALVWALETLEPVRTALGG